MCTTPLSMKTLFSSDFLPWVSLSGIYDTTNLVVLKFSTKVSEMTDEQIEIGLKEVPHEGANFFVDNSS